MDKIILLCVMYNTPNNIVMAYVFSFGLNRNNTNNGQLRGIKAMPLKDLNSDSNSSFSADRQAYANLTSVTANVTPAQSLTKKWVGGNRDASDVSAKRRVIAAGTSMNPAGGEFSFTSKTEKNTRIDALNRCRNQGNCVPPKVRHSPHLTNVPARYWNPNLQRTQNHAVLTKGTPMQPKSVALLNNGYS